MEMCEMLKDITRNKFKYPCILCLRKMLFLLTPAFQQLSDQSIRGVCLKILQGLVSQRDDCVMGRLGPDIIVHLCRTVAELVRVIWTHNNKVVIMDCPTLNMNTHENQLVAGSIPGFLAAKSAVLEIFLISGIKASFHTSRDTVDTMKSLAGSASALLLSFTSTSLGRAVTSYLTSLDSKQNMELDWLVRFVHRVTAMQIMEQVLGVLLLDHF